MPSYKVVAVAAVSRPSAVTAAWSVFSVSPAAEYASSCIFWETQWWEKKILLRNKAMVIVLTAVDQVKHP